MRLRADATRRWVALPGSSENSSCDDPDLEPPNRGPTAACASAHDDEIDTQQARS
jgi:hypothetical protein